MRAARAALLAGGVAVGVAAELVSHESTPALTGADLTVGCVLLACGYLARDSRVAALTMLAGCTWFLGNFAAPLLFLHRGPLVHLLVSDRSGRVRGRLARATVALAYAHAAIAPLARQDVLTLALATLVAATALQLTSRAPAVAFAAVLALGAVERLATGGAHADASLWLYDVGVAGAAIGLLVARRRSSEAAVTRLVLDLGTADGGTLREKLARALGDPSLAIGYRLAGMDRFVDDAGRPVELPQPGSGRTVTPLERVAVLVHDEALLADRRLLESVAAAARMAVVNARLQAEARAQAGELEASRRRIVEAADAQRRRIERQLRAGAGRRLETVAALLAGAGRVEHELAEARVELDEFARGLHPAALADGGLMPALAVLAERSPVRAELNGTVARLPEPVEAALYFVCSEALANVAKHASAKRVSIDVQRGRVAIADDGVGGADPAAGSGLRGLADRVEALGGTLRVTSAPGGGTRVEAEIPVSARA